MLQSLKTVECNLDGLYSKSTVEQRFASELAATWCKSLRIVASRGGQQAALSKCNRFLLRMIENNCKTLSCLDADDDHLTPPVLTSLLHCPNLTKLDMSHARCVSQACLSADVLQHLTLANLPNLTSFSCFDPKWEFLDLKPRVLHCILSEGDLHIGFHFQFLPVQGFALSRFVWASSIRIRCRSSLCLISLNSKNCVAGWILTTANLLCCLASPCRK